MSYAIILLRGTICEGPALTTGPRGRSMFLRVRAGDTAEHDVIIRDPAHMVTAAELRTGDEIAVKGAIGYLPRPGSRTLRAACYITQPDPIHHIRRPTTGGDDADAPA
ncbi:hypothetical protein P7L78_19220 [Tistrella bauzanensis]|uniref:hypothetical protein n=1 Tax=Tistrella TaxID=171436 RepID=UPI0031F618E2